MDKKVRVYISISWLLVVLVPMVVITFQLNFPAINYNLYGHIIIPILLALPLITLVYTVIAYKTGKSSKIADGFVLAGLIITILYTAVFTLGFRYWGNALYPLASTTRNPENYLVIEDEYAEYDTREIYGVFPKEIPAEASDVEYYYYCNGFGHYWIEAKWKLPNDKYMVEKRQAIYGNGEVTNTSDGLIYDCVFNENGYIAKKEFVDSDCSIKYYFERLN